jgi:hypothetical protein
VQLQKKLGDAAPQSGNALMPPKIVMLIRVSAHSRPALLP